MFDLWKMLTNTIKRIVSNNKCSYERKKEIMLILLDCEQMLYDSLTEIEQNIYDREFED